MINKTKSFCPKRPSFTVDSAATIYAGRVVEQTTNASGNKVVQLYSAVTHTPYGIAWGEKATSVIALVTYEPVTFSAGAGLTQNLGHANLLGADAANTRQWSVVNAAHTVQYTPGVDYSINVTNGTITNLAGAIGATGTVHVTYKYWVPANQMNYYGQTYDHAPDDTIGSGMLTVVQGNATIYTDQYDSTLVYALDDAVRPCIIPAGADPVKNGMLTNTVIGTIASPTIGKVVELPTAASPYLGVEILLPSAAFNV